MKTPWMEAFLLGQAQARPGYSKLGLIAAGELPYQDFGYRLCHATGSSCSSQNDKIPLDTAPWSTTSTASNLAYQSRIAGYQLGLQYPCGSW